MKNSQVCGFAAILGRPNVGKSTLINHILGQKLCITSRKPHTTRHRVLGVHSTASGQLILVDTPGIQTSQTGTLNKALNKTALASIAGIDVVLFMVEALKWENQDEQILQKLENVGKPVILLINKVDRCKDKARLLPYIARLSKQYEFTAIMPISARSPVDCSNTAEKIMTMLPEGMPLFPQDQITDRSEQFFCMELIREKVMRQLGDELPYQTAVQIENFEKVGKKFEILANIMVESKSQRAIVIGEKGQRIKEIGVAARKDIESFLGKKVHLSLWVKIKRGWSQDERLVKQYGYHS